MIKSSAIKREDLMSIHYIELEISEWKEELQKKYASMVPKLLIDGKALGRGAYRHSITEDISLSIIEIEKKIQSKIKELENVRNKIILFIMGIDDCQVRLIIKLRCLDCMNWNQVADKVGGGNTEYSVKKRFYRYLDKMGIK